MASRRSESYTQRMNRQERRKEMIRKTRLWFEENRPGYTPVDNGVATKGDVCNPLDKNLNGGCGQLSLVRYYNSDKTEIIRVCIRRFDTRKDRGCSYSDKVPVGYDRFVKKAKLPEKNAASTAV